MPDDETTTEEHVHTFPAVDTDAGHETPRGEPGPENIYGLEVEEGEDADEESAPEE